MIIRKLDNPKGIEEGDVFAASLLMWTLSIQNRKVEASVHALGVVQMLKFMQKDNKEVYDSSLMLKVFGPLVFGDATFSISLGLELCFGR
jgi:hypothetical protein